MLKYWATSASFQDIRHKLCVVEDIQDIYINNTLQEILLIRTDKKSGKPRNFITVPLDNPDLARDLEKHGVKYSMAVESHFLRDLLFAWIIPFAVIFLLWGFLSRKMGSAGMNFLNIGKNRAHIHAETEQKVTFLRSNLRT